MEPLKKKSLFWDVDTVNLDANKEFVIGRILNFGDIDDMQWALRVYGQKELEKGVLNNRGLNAKSLSFWCQYFGISPEACIAKLSKKTPSAFSQR